jgi:hypothetical protein
MPNNLRRTGGIVMKMDVRTSVALCLLAVTVSAAAQNLPEEQTVPAPQQNAPATSPPAPTQSAQPSTSAPQSTPAPESPAPQRYHYTPYTQPSSSKAQWSHSETTYYETEGFRYHPFRFHIDGGGTITQQANATLLNNGWNAGLGFSWFPTSHLPIGIRVDGTYNQFDMRQALLDRATAAYGTRVDDGTQKLFGGDVDLELDFHFSPYVRMYLLAGGGWYRQQSTFRQRNYYNGILLRGQHSGAQHDRMDFRQKRRLRLRVRDESMDFALRRSALHATQSERLEVRLPADQGGPALLGPLCLARYAHAPERQTERNGSGHADEHDPAEAGAAAHEAATEPQARVSLNRLAR